MPIKISKALKSSIAKVNSIKTEDVEDHLWNKSGEKCFLCDEDLNRASDDIEVDHDTPVDDGGDNSLANLNLTHAPCNRFKKANKSNAVRPMLRFKAFLAKKTEPIDYSGALEFFKIKPKNSVLTIKGNTANFELPDGNKVSTPVFTTKSSTGTFSFCYVELPQNAIDNDPDCQPRTIKPGHLFSIVNDLDTNPLHEAPCCRLVTKNGKTKLAMFDGQHKTLACWLRGEEKLVYKIYLDITQEQAVVLVNSIQSKIKKLPLTPFELAAKLSDQYRDELEQYETDVGSTECSEEGFIKWLPQPKRKGAKTEIQAAVIQRTINSSNLEILDIIERHGKKLPIEWSITESAFQTNILKQLMHVNPLPEENFKGHDMELAREREELHICKALNILYEGVFAGLTEASSENDRERARRMKYGASLRYLANLIKRVAITRIVPTKPEYVFIEKPIKDKIWDTIKKDIKRIIDHPVWITPLDKSEKMKAVETALTKNQNYELAFTNVQLTPGYAVGADDLTSNACT